VPKPAAKPPAAPALAPVEEEELVEILPEDAPASGAPPFAPAQPPAFVPPHAVPPQQPAPGPGAGPGELIPSTPGWQQAALLRPRHLSVRPKKGFTGPDFKIMDMKSKEQIGGGWKKGKRQKGGFFEGMLKAAAGMAEVDVFIREDKDAPVVFSVRVVGKMSANGNMSLIEGVEIYDENENPAGSVRFSVNVLFEELKAFLIFDARNNCVAKSERRHVKSQRTKQKVPYVALIDGNGEEVGKITTEQREVVEEEERQGFLLGAFDAHGITARVSKNYNTPSTRVLLLSVLLTLKLTGAWEGGLETRGR
jgi:hypothetical protein